MALVKVGKRGAMVISSRDRRKAAIAEGDRVEVIALAEGELLVKRTPSLREVQRRMAGKLPQWNELEGKADELLGKELNF